MNSEVIMREYSWTTLVKKADSDFGKKDVAYEFSNGRKFDDTPSYSQTFTIWDPDYKGHPQTIWDGGATDWDTR